MAAGLAIVRTVSELRAQVVAWRRDGARVALVPTMGALHAGHLSLIRLARAHADRVVASIFVNPRQFGPNEDFDTYPRTEAADVEALAAAACDALYAPPPSEIYPSGFATTVDVAGVSAGLCGGDRPAHFAGVATIVAKLFLQARPDVAVFGEKDWQQLAVIRRMTRDLDLEVAILGAPIARAADGLALSSRNAYLDAASRTAAPRLYATLCEAAAALSRGEDVAGVQATAKRALLGGGFERVDYLEVREAESLIPVGPGPLRAEATARLLAAAWIGATRLIDNLPVARSYHAPSSRSR